jgi:hypothetical protein
LVFQIGNLGRSRQGWFFGAQRFQFLEFNNKQDSIAYTTDLSLQYSEFAVDMPWITSHDLSLSPCDPQHNLPFSHHKR